MKRSLGLSDFGELGCGGIEGHGFRLFSRELQRGTKSPPQSAAKPHQVWVCADSAQRSIPREFAHSLVMSWS